MSQGRFLKTDEHEGWEIYKDLAEKILHWEPNLEESRNVNPISSKRGLHLIEMSITYEVKFDGITRRLEDLETTDLSPWTKSGLHNSHLRVVLTVKLWTMCSKSILFFFLIKHCPVPCIRPTNNPYSKPTIPVGEIIRISRRPKTPMINLGQPSLTISNHLIINKIFPIKLHHFLSKINYQIWKERWIPLAKPKKH